MTEASMVAAGFLMGLFAHQVLGRGWPVAVAAGVGVVVMVFA